MAPLVGCVMVAFASVFRDSNMFLVFSCYFDDFLVMSGVSAFTKTARARFKNCLNIVQQKRENNRIW